VRRSRRGGTCGRDSIPLVEQVLVRDRFERQSPTEHQVVPHYREPESRRVVQRIFDHLLRSNCRSMWVRKERESPEIRVLYIRPCDFKLAAEVVASNIATKLKVEFSPPKNGWIRLTLGSGGQELIVPMSYTPFDSLNELASAAAAFLESGRESVARLNSEPEEYDVLFESGTVTNAQRVRVVHYRHGRRMKSDFEVVFVHEGDPLHIGRTLWRALRKLESGFDSHQWSHGFPTEMVRNLGALTAAVAQ
jgi:hypothetical protein